MVTSLGMKKCHRRLLVNNLFKGLIAQLGERLVRNQQVRSSILLGSKSENQTTSTWFRLETGNAGQESDNWVSMMPVMIPRNFWEDFGLKYF